MLLVDANFNHLDVTANQQFYDKYNTIATQMLNFKSYIYLI